MHVNYVIFDIMSKLTYMASDTCKECKVDKDGLLYAEGTAPDIKTKKVPVIPKHLGKSIILLSILP